MTKRTSRKKPVLGTKSIKEVQPDQGAESAEGKRPDGVMSTGSIKEVLSETPPEKLIEEEEMIVSEIMDVKSIVVSMPLPRKMFRGNELGPADRIVHKPRDPGANHNIEITLNDETIYVAQFRNGKARIPQKVAEHIRATFPPGRLVVAD